MDQAESPTESETYPEADPGIAYDLMRDRLMYQQMAVDGLDNKLAIGLSTSGLVVTILAGFLASRGTELGTRDTLSLAAVGLLFVIGLACAVKGLHPMEWKGVTWDDMMKKTDKRWPKQGLTWSVAKQLAAAGDENDLNLEAKRRMLAWTFRLVVAQIAIATLGLGLSAS